MPRTWNPVWLAVPIFIAAVILLWPSTAPSPAQAPAKMYWRLYKIDVEDDHDKTDGLVPQAHPDGSITRTIIPDKGRRSVGSVWRVWPKEGRASYVRPKPEPGSLEVSWTVPPEILRTDEDLKLAISVVARGEVWGGAQFGDSPVEQFVVQPDPKMNNAWGPLGGVRAGKHPQGFLPSASGYCVTRIRPRHIVGQKDQGLYLYLVDGDYGWQVHYHYEPVEKEPPPPPPPHKCEYTFAKEWNTTWGKFIIRLDGVKATGTYSNRDGKFGPGTFSGAVTGHVLEAEWKDDQGEGTLTLFLQSDGCGFSGQHTVKTTTPPPQPPPLRPGPITDSKPKPTDPPVPPPEVGNDPTAQRCIDEWIKLAMSIRNRRDKSNPAPGGLWRVNEYGQLLGHAVISGQPPEGWETRYQRNRYIVIWETWQQSHKDPAYGGELPPLADYVKDCQSKHGPPPPPPPPRTTKMTIRAEHRTVIAGETVLVPVWLDNGVDVANINFTVAYDGGVAKPDANPTAGNLLGEALFSANPKDPGLIRLGFAQSKGLSGTGTVAYLPFKAVGKPGDRTALHLEVSILNNPAGTVLPIDKIDGSITIVGPDGLLPGDCDGDGQLTALDAKCALDMSVQLIPEKKNLDMDGDGSVTSRDATIILQRRAMALARSKQ